MNAYFRFRQDLYRGAKLRLMALGLQPTQQAARKLVDQEIARLRALQEKQQSPWQDLKEANSATPA